MGEKNSAWTYGLLSEKGVSMKKLVLTLIVLGTLSNAFAGDKDKAAKKCVFEDKQLGELFEAGSGFKNIKKDDRYMGIPKIFDSYDELGEFSKRECKKAVKVTKMVSFEDHNVYTLYYTNEDYCDGGNSYGLILGTKEQSPRGDKVIATITDSFIDCLTK